jgi:hypothetical protein
MKLLVLYQARDAIKDQPGYHDGFCRLVAEGLLEAHRALSYLGVSERQGWDGLWKEAYETAREMEADAIFLQFFHGGSIPDPSSGIQRLKTLASRPTVFTSLGDPFGRVTKKVPQCFRAASALSDISFLTGMGYLSRQLIASGSKNLVLMPNGCCQVRFSSRRPGSLNQPEFDLAFVGSRIRSRNPLSHFYWVSRKRVEFVEAATKRYGRRFGLFGKGWEGNPSWQGPIAYAAQHGAYYRSAVALGGMPNAYHDYYTSDRVFIAAASGVPLVDYWVPGVDRVLEPGRDWWLAHNQKEMFGLCDNLLEMADSDRIRRGQEARERILARHTQYHRCKQMIDIVRSLREARLSGRNAAEPELSFLSNSRAVGSPPNSIVGWER